MEEIMNIISTLGFPIFMVLYFIYDKNKTTEAMFNEVKENSDNNTQMIKNLAASVTDSVNNNTLVLTKFIEHFGLTSSGSDVNE